MDILTFINEYWSVLAFIGVVIISWVRYEGKNNTQDKDIEELRKECIDIKLEVKDLKTKQESNDKIISKLEVTLGKIETSLEFILKKLDDK